MKIKSIVLTAIFVLSFKIILTAQNIPNYISNNQLIGWWPFNGNAIDESNNGNEGTVYGASLTTDRFGNSNSAYNFNGLNNWIDVNHNEKTSITGSYTISVWVNIKELPSPSSQTRASWEGIVTKGGKGDGNGEDHTYSLAVQNYDEWSPSTGIYFGYENSYGINIYANKDVDNFFTSDWHHLTGVYNHENNTLKLYIDGVLIVENTNANDIPNINNKSLLFGCGTTNPSLTLKREYFFNGLLDDIAIWSRPLAQQEVVALFNADDCKNLTITPQTNNLALGSSAIFKTTKPVKENSKIIWQSDFGQGFQNLIDYESYTGTTTQTLTISDIKSINHHQPIRAIFTSNECTDTSNVAQISLTDTCKNTVLISVTDTLIIHVPLITSVHPANTVNTLKIFPNPASTHITINYDDFTTMNQYSLSIINSNGQEMFATAINQQISIIDLSTWTGKGIYFIQVIDSQNNIIENRKIIIQ